MIASIIFSCIFIAAFGGCIFYICAERRKAKTAPILTISVYMVRKYIVPDDDGPTRYYGDFVLQDGKTVKLDVSSVGYQNLPESGSCVITYKYKTLLDFKYLGAIDEKANVPKTKQRHGKSKTGMIMVIIVAMYFIITFTVKLISNGGDIDSVIVIGSHRSEDKNIISAVLEEAYTDDGDFYLSFKTEDGETVSYEVSDATYQVLSRCTNSEGRLTTENEKFVSFVLK